MDLTGDYPVTAELDWHFLPGGELAPLAGTGRVKGDLQALRIVHRTTGRLTSGFEGELSDLLDAPTWRALVRVDDVSTHDFTRDAPAGSVAGHFSGTGTFSDASVTGTVTAELEGLDALGRLEARVDAEIEQDLLSVSQLNLSASEAPGSLQARGRIQLTGEAPGRFDVDAEWRDLAWPPGEAPEYQLPAGTLKASGTADAFSHEVATRIESATLPPADVQWEGQATPGSMTVDTLQVDTLGGHIDGIGELRWHPALAWSADLVAADLQPALKWPGLRGLLGARVETTGRMTEVLEARVRLWDLSGELQDRPVAGQGLVHWTDGTLTVEELSLGAGSNRLAVTGTVGETLGLAADIDAPDLSVLVPGAVGELRLTGQVTGPLSRPAIDGEFSVRRLEFGDASLDNADGHVRVGTRPGDALDVNLRADGLRAGTLSWNT